MEMIRLVAQAFRTPDREELRGVLAEKLVVLKQRKNPAIRDWRAYLAKFLYNKASNWVRDARARERRHQIGPAHLAARSREARGVYPEITHDAAALAAARDELSHDLRRFWDILVQENGNQTRAARLVGIHRNTGRAWVQKIREILHHHEF